MLALRWWRPRLEQDQQHSPWHLLGLALPSLWLRPWMESRVLWNVLMSGKSFSLFFYNWDMLVIASVSLVVIVCLIYSITSIINKSWCFYPFVFLLHCFFYLFSLFFLSLFIFQLWSCTLKQESNNRIPWEAWLIVLPPQVRPHWSHLLLHSPCPGSQWYWEEPWPG